MNIIKIKTMVVSRENKPVSNMNISIPGMPTQQTNSVIYLGHMVTEDYKCKGEVTRRTELSRAAFDIMAAVLTSRNISINVKPHIGK